MDQDTRINAEEVNEHVPGVVESQQELSHLTQHDADFLSAPPESEQETPVIVPSPTQHPSPLAEYAMTPERPINQEVEEEHNVLIQLGIPTSNSAPDPSEDSPHIEERSRSPGEELFDQVAHETDEHVLFEDDVNSDWPGSTAKETQDIQHEIDGERIPLVEDTEDPQQTPFFNENPTTRDPFFSDTSNADIEADTNWMHSNIDDALQHSTLDQGTTTHSLPTMETSADTFFEDHDQEDDHVPIDQSTDEPQSTTDTAFEDLLKPDPAPMGIDAPADKIEDSWSQAFETGELDEESWDNAFASNLDDDDPLEEDTPDTDSNHRYTPSMSDPSRPPSLLHNPQQSTSFPAASASALPQPSQPQSQERAKPMEFFAELPTANVRSRKPQRNTSLQTQPTPLPPPSAPVNSGQSSS